MFAGIVEDTASVRSFENRADFRRLVVASNIDLTGTQPGDSIAIDGVCLTVIDYNLEGGLIEFDIAEETMRRSSFGRLRPGSIVNIERSLRLGDRISGHFVFGHVDTQITLKDLIDEGVNIAMRWEFPSQYKQYIATKGSVAIAGVSLTVGEIQGNTFTVYVVPHTLEKTNLGLLKTGAQVNLEFDMLARYVVSALAGAQAS